MLEALSFQAVFFVCFVLFFGSMLKFLVEWMPGQSLRLFPLDGNFVFASAFLRLKVCDFFHLLDSCASHST